MKSYQDLEVWQKAMDFVVMCYQMITEFLKSETYGLSSQLQRSAVSVPANIAEDRQRQYSKEFLQHLSIAYGSHAEVESHIQIAGRLNYVGIYTCVETRRARSKKSSRSVVKYSCKNVKIIFLL